MIRDYAWRGGREAMLCMGPEGGPAVLILQPLFEEANRTRRILVEVMRGLAAEGIASALPDLPGTGDSPVATVDARLDDWRAAAAAAADALPRPRFTIALRAGALLDDAADVDDRWRLAPVAGKSVLRDMIRATALTGELKAAALEDVARAAPTMLAGNLLHPELFVALDAAAPVEIGAHIADLPGTPWRRAEPGDDAELVAAMVADISGWVRSCVAH